MKIDNLRDLKKRTTKKIKDNVKKIRKKKRKNYTHYTQLFLHAAVDERKNIKTKETDNVAIYDLSNALILFNFLHSS